MIGRLFANVLSGYFTVCGAGALIVALVLSRRAIRLLGGERAAAVVVRYQLRRRARLTSSDHYMPVFRFRPGAGVELEVQSLVGTRFPEKLPPGSPVTVLYDPENPQRAEIANTWRIWAGAGAFLVLATGALLAALKAGA